MTFAGSDSPDAWPTPSHPPPGVTAVADVFSDPETVGFVHVARGDDPDRRYLTRDPEPHQPAAVVCLPAASGSQADNDGMQAVYSVPDGHSDTAVAAFVATDDDADESDRGLDEITRTVATREPETPPGTHAVTMLADRLGDRAGAGTLRVPSHLPHDAAVRLQRAGYDLASTAAVTEARADKTAAERDCLRFAQRAAVHGIARATDHLAAATADDGRCYVDGEPLSATRLEREVATAVAETGVVPETVAVDAPETDPTAGLPAGDGIVVRVVSRGPHGYHSHLIRTVVVDSDGGWDRRAHIAAEAGLDAARTHCQPGTSVATVAAEARAELTAYGFPPRTATDDGERDESSADAGSTATVHGIGLAPVEAPSPSENVPLESGTTLAIEVGVADPDHGRLRLGSVVEVGDDGGERLVESSLSLTPETAD